MEFLPKVVKVPCSVMEEGATEVEAEAPTRVVLTAALVTLGEVMATLVFVSAPELVTLAPESVVVPSCTRVVVSLFVLSAV